MNGNVLSSVSPLSTLHEVGVSMGRRCIPFLFVAYTFVSFFFSLSCLILYKQQSVMEQISKIMINNNPPINKYWTPTSNPKKVEASNVSALPSSSISKSTSTSISSPVCSSIAASNSCPYSSSSMRSTSNSLLEFSAI